MKCVELSGLFMSVATGTSYSSASVFSATPDTLNFHTWLKAKAACVGEISCVAAAGCLPTLLGTGRLETVSSQPVISLRTAVLSR